MEPNFFYTSIKPKEETTFSLFKNRKETETETEILVLNLNWNRKNQQISSPDYKHATG